jgi:hypothetical protein
MEEYTLINRFIERYSIEEHRKVISRKVRILNVESMMLKKKREYERE